jgi:uncharacterized protein (DUF885 family)
VRKSGLLGKFSGGALGLRFLSLALSANFVICSGFGIAANADVMSSSGQELLAAKSNSAPSTASIRIAAQDNSVADANFLRLVDKYFAYVFSIDPALGTQLGIHEYDTAVPDLSASAISDSVKRLKSFLNDFETVKSKELSPQSNIDLKLITSNIKGRLLMLDELKEWQRNPDMYSSLSSSMIYDLMARNFAPLSERLKSVIAREKAIPALLAAAKINLKNPPKIYTEIAIDQAGGIIDFFKTDVPNTFKSVTDKQLQDEFAQVNGQCIAKLEEYQKFLKDEDLPKSSSSFAYGPEIYAKKLQYDEMVDTPIDQLITDGDKELKRLQSEFDKTAKEIDPSKSPIEVFRSIALEHAAPDKLLDSTRAMLSDLREFCLKNKIISMPWEGDLRVEETPPFMRALTFAAMSWSGPFEEKSKESFYYVTLPEKSWAPEKVEQHMRSFGRFSLMDTSVHEVFPGHYVQGLWLRVAPSKTTKIIGSNSNIEGWAHYGEQMMVEQGLENGDKRLKLAMLHKALRRCCRYLVALKMHTKGMTLDEAISFFVNEAHEERANAERESRRGAIDATYLVYTLGKLQIMSLREDYKKAKGDKFTLLDFHNAFLGTGAPPVKIIREVLLGDSK